MRVLNLSLGQDTGGQQGRTAEAFATYAPDWHYDSVARVRTFYPIGAWHPHTIRNDLWPKADVVHLHNSTAALTRFERHGRKPAVVHYHGSAYRTEPLGKLARQRQAGALGIVSTLDLQLIAPDDTEWLPAPYELPDFAGYRVRRDDGILRIAHAPTNRAIKGTEALVAAVDRLRREGRRVELDIIERRPWAECLRRKGRADVYVDQCLLGYGCNAIEAWAMGMPVVAGVDPARALERIHQRIPDGTRESMVRRFGGRLPFYEATEDTLYAALADLADPATRQAYASFGMAHAERFHAAHRVVERLRRIYTRAYYAV